MDVLAASRIMLDPSRVPAQGLLPHILVRCTELRFAIDRVRLEGEAARNHRTEEAQDVADLEHGHSLAPAGKTITLTLLVKGKRRVSHLLAALSNIQGVQEVGRVSEAAERE